jgi:hypothetical protein
MVDPVKPEPKFEFIGSDGLFSGLLHLRYGTGQDDHMPFTLTLTPQYVAREIKKTLPVSFLRVQRYAERNADKLKAIAKLERERGLNAHPRIGNAPIGSCLDGAEGATPGSSA